MLDVLNDAEEIRGQEMVVGKGTKTGLGESVV